VAFQVILVAANAIHLIENASDKNKHPFNLEKPASSQTSLTGENFSQTELVERLGDFPVN